MEPAQYAVPVPYDRARRVDHGRQATVACPEAPLLQERFDRGRGLIVDFLEGELDLKGPGGFQLRASPALRGADQVLSVLLRENRFRLDGMIPDPYQVDPQSPEPGLFWVGVPFPGSRLAIPSDVTKTVYVWYTHIHAIDVNGRE